MATTEALLAHLETLQRSVNAAINDAHAWQNFGGKLTATARAAQLATVTTVPAERLHASDCAICTAWDGTAWDGAEG